MHKHPDFKGLLSEGCANECALVGLSLMFEDVRILLHLVGAMSDSEKVLRVFALEFRGAQ